MDPERRAADAPAPVVIGQRACDLLQALLQVDAADARRVRERTPARRRPRRQVGPTADYGAAGGAAGDDADGDDADGSEQPAPA